MLEAFAAANDGDKDKAKAMCMALRTDGKSVDIDGDSTISSRAAYPTSLRRAPFAPMTMPFWESRST